MMFVRIRDLREDNDLTQVQVANALGISQSRYSQYERGECAGIPVSIIEKLALFYGVSVDYLVEETDELEPYERNL